MSSVSWQSPTGHNVVGRRWDDAPPAWVMYEAIVLEQDDWLTLLTGEKPAVVARSRRPDRVLLQPWLDTSLTAVELHIGGHGFGGSRILVLAYADEPELSDEARRWTRYRLGTIFGEGVRRWVDAPRSR